eukprot:245469-Heterocapsa_arctica.AAC.1
MNHDSDKQEVDQVHRYVHGGSLQRGTQVETNIVEMKVDTENGETQNNPEEDQEKESSIETQEHWHTAGDRQD